MYERLPSINEDFIRRSPLLNGEGIRAHLGREENCSADNSDNFSMREVGQCVFIDGNDSSLILGQLFR